MEKEEFVQLTNECLQEQGLPIMTKEQEETDYAEFQREGERYR